MAAMGAMRFSVRSFHAAHFFIVPEKVRNQNQIEREVCTMADMGTKEAAELWGVSQRKVQNFCRETNDPRITQDKPKSPYHIPKDYPNPFERRNEQ